MNYSQAMEYVNSFPVVTGKQTDNEALLSLLERLGNPHEQVKCVHVAGTNGKGSVCAYLSTVLAGNGYQVGLFTSPYLQKINERIQISGKCITNTDFAKCLTEVRKAYEEGSYSLSCFAILTAVMFLYFQKKKVDIAVIEVGMGGRIDPTNVCKPLVSVITSIAMDHAQYLGGTLESIAAEKAGIIRRGVPVVIAPNVASVRAVIKETCVKKGAPMKEVSPDREVIRVSLEETSFAYKNMMYKTSLLGKHQVSNACTALEALQLLRLHGFESKQTRRLLAQTVWPARLQMLSREPLVLLDGAHNPQGAQTVADFARSLGEKFALVSSVSKDKDVEGIVEALAPVAHCVFACAYQGPRAAEPEALASLFRERGVKSESFSALDEALVAAKQTGLPVLICGSLYLAGEALTLKEKEQADA